MEAKKAVTGGDALEAVIAARKKLVEAEVDLMMMLANLEDLDDGEFFDSLGDAVERMAAHGEASTAGLHGKARTARLAEIVEKFERDELPELQEMIEEFRREDRMVAAGMMQ